MTPGCAPPLLELRGIGRVYRLRRGAGIARPGTAVAALEDVDLTVGGGEVIGIVGESGSGKTTLGRIAAGSLAPSAGRRLWKGNDTADLDRAGQRALRLAVQMIFQDAHAALNPRLTAGRAVGEGAAVHHLTGTLPLRDYVADTLKRVGLDPGLAQRYPHQLSGGQRSRVGIARALAVRPELLVADEPVAALDAAARAELVQLFARLSRENSLAMLLISHDLGIVRQLARRVAILYFGRIVELAPVSVLFAGPHHPYAQALLADMPRLEERHRTYRPLPGEPPVPWAPPSGCPFHPRCPHAFERCRQERPRLRRVDADHESACHLGDG